MARLRVVTDSTADFAPEPAEDLGITVVPLTVIFGRESFQDKAELSTHAFYERLRASKALPTTSAPSVGAFEAAYERLLHEADHVLSIHIAASLSATWSAAKTAAQNVAPERITVLDSGQITLCLGWAAMHAAERAKREAGVETIVHELQELFPRLRLYPALDTLEFLQRGGRIGKASAFLGALLHIKPILLIQHGEVLPAERVRTRAAAVRRLADIAASLSLERLGVIHGDAPDSAAELHQLLRQRFPERDLPIGEIGSVLGTHAGPGVFGFACLMAK